MVVPNRSVVISECESGAADTANVARFDCPARKICARISDTHFGLQRGDGEADKPRSLVFKAGGVPARHSENALGARRQMSVAGSNRVAQAGTQALGRTGKCDREPVKDRFNNVLQNHARPCLSLGYQ
jgi:hypothetical protein